MMWCLETLDKLNAPGYERRLPNPLRYHPKILQVRRFVNSMPVPYDYKMRLNRSIYRYAEQIIAYPVSTPDSGWGLEDEIQQVTLGDWNEETIMSQFR